MILIHSFVIIIHCGYIVWAPIETIISTITFYLHLLNIHKMFSYPLTTPLEESIRNAHTVARDKQRNIYILLRILD